MLGSVDKDESVFIVWKAEITGPSHSKFNLFLVGAQMNH